MNTSTPYVMRDQVKNVVPTLMNRDVTGSHRERTSFTELAIFAVVTLAYLVALGLTT